LQEEGQEEDWSGEGEICGGAKGGSRDGVALFVEEQKEGRGEGGGGGDRLRGTVVEQGEGDGGQGDKDGQEGKVVERELCDCVCRAVGAVIFVLPGVDEKAVEATEGGEEKRGREKRQTEIGTTGDGGDEGSGGEAEAYGDFLGKSMGASGGVDENEVATDQASEDEIEVDGFGVEAGEKSREGDGGEDDSGEEGGAMTVVEVVAGFEVFVMGWVGVEETSVHQTGVH
jgi:hypothetical protein